MPVFYSQKSYNNILGNCRNETIKKSGCFLTSLCNLNLYLKFTKETTPPEMNDLFTRKNLWVDGCMISAPKIASFFNLEYFKKTSSEMLCIAETNHFSKLGVPQHFFLYDPERKERVDPLDLAPVWEPNTYHIVSYRIFKTIQTEPEPIQTDGITEWLEQPIDLSGGQNLPPEPPKPEVSDTIPPISFIAFLWLKIKELLGL